MAKTSMEIVMIADLKQRLHAAAAKLDKTVQEVAQDALYTYVEDIEDGVLSDVALAQEGLSYIPAEGAQPVALDRSVFQAGRKTA